METLSLAILMTCYNRRQKTLSCLEVLQKQELLPNLAVQVYLVDDGSTDGTGEAVKTTYPEIKMLQGDGNLFWNRGMRLAFSEAIKSDYDYYLWLNDDTLLYPGAIRSLLETSHHLVETGHTLAIVVGSTQDAKTGRFSYGGVARVNRWHPLRFEGVEPGDEVKPCLTLNGNAVLIPRRVIQKVGNLDPAFTHSTGDVDYGLRVHQQGGSVWIAPGYVGACEYNPLRHQAWDDPNLTLRERWQKINEPRGLPITEWRVFAQRHAGFFWFFYWLLPYVRLFLKTFTLRPLRNHQT